MIYFWTEEGEEDSEEAGPAKKEEQTQESNQTDGQNNGPLEASPSSEGEERAEEEESSSEPDRASSTEEGQSACGSTDTNSQDANDGDQSAGAEPAGKEEEDEEEEEEDGEGAATCAQANKRVPGRRHYTERRKKALFTIQAVNSNGTTERGMAEAGSSFSFSCEYTNEKLNLLQTSLLLMPLYNFRVMCAQARVITKWDYTSYLSGCSIHTFSKLKSGCHGVF